MDYYPQGIAAFDVGLAKYAEKVVLHKFLTLSTQMFPLHTFIFSSSIEMFLALTELR